MKNLIIIISTILVISCGYLYFYIFGAPDMPTSTSPETVSAVKNVLANFYSVSSVKSTIRTYEFEGTYQKTKWLIIKLDNQPITSNEEKWSIAEKVCKAVLKFDYEGVYIYPTTIHAGANCGSWGP